ncbi:alpha/beta hydrolase [bacterium]|nr:MAG: alpha/beta hydrolase [bacterium]
MNPSPEFFTPSGVRLRQRSQRPGKLNWLFLPGGPGIGSESLHELMDTLDVPGRLWGVDLPWDGSNDAPPGATGEPYHDWPGVLIEAARALPNPVFIGHSTAGMYLLSTPELEVSIVGLALVSTAPNSSWHPRFVEMTQRHPLPAVDAATLLYEAEPTLEGLRDVAVASAEWNFTPGFLETGRELLGRMPYNPAAVEWSDKNFDHTYAATWWPASLPTLILSGGDDRIVDQSLWDSSEFEASHVLHRTVEGGAHFLWIEKPEEVGSAFAEFATKIEAAFEKASTPS